MAEPNSKPLVWQMVKQAVDALGSPTTNVAVRDWILAKYPNTKRGTINCQIAVCTVNHNSRIHWPENQKPRTANGAYDILFRPARGQLELYDPERHGLWRIAKTEDGQLFVCRSEDSASAIDTATSTAVSATTVDETSTFAMEAHLRDYLAANLGKIEEGLELYVDDEGNSGVEYPTPVGRIDILAMDRNGAFVVVELKVSRGSDAACGQLLRYKGWVREHLADGGTTRGIVIASHVTDRMRYAAGEAQDVELIEYALDLTLQRVGPQGDQTP